MTTKQVTRLAALAWGAALVASCGGGGGDSAPAPVAVGEYLSALPTWDAFSKPLADKSPEKVPDVPADPDKRNPKTSQERIDTVTDGVITSTQYACTTTKFTLQSTPEKIVMFSPDREILWPGALIQGRSHRDGVGSLLPLPIRERAPIKVSIPSLATDDNFRVVEAPDQAEVNQAIGDLIAKATASKLVPPSSIQFTMSDFTSDKAFALKTKMSGKYLGFTASASASVETRANERTVMVYFLEKMFEVVVEPPEAPGAFFSETFTRDKLDEQIAMDRIGHDNLPVYVSNIVYGRMMAFTFTSSASSTEIEAALNASYKGIFDASFEVDPKYSSTFENAKIAVTSLGGNSSATVAMIASGDWRDYFKKEAAPLTSAYPLSYTFRNLGDGSIAKVVESTSYDVKECTPVNTAGFMVDSFETTANWTHDNIATATDPGATLPLAVSLGNEASPLSIFYGYEVVKHTNYVDAANNDRFIYDVGYIRSPHFTGDQKAYYRGELSFWHRPDAVMYTFGTPIRRCYTWIRWILFIPIPEVSCYWLQSPLNGEENLKVGEHTVLAYDDSTTADQLILRGGSQNNEYERLTLTYNPKSPELPLEWQRHVISLANDDSAGKSLCTTRLLPDDPTIADKDKRTVYYGCWLVEDRPATEYEMQYVLGYVTELKLRASNAVHATRPVCTEALAASCPSYTPKDVLLGYVGGYFDDIKIVKPQSGF